MDGCDFTGEVMMHWVEFCKIIREQSMNSDSSFLLLPTLTTTFNLPACTFINYNFTPAKGQKICDFLTSLPLLSGFILNIIN